MPNKEIPTNLETKISVSVYDLVSDVIHQSGMDNMNSSDYVTMHNRLMQLIDEVVLPQGNMAWYQGLVLYLKNEYDKKHH